MERFSDRRAGQIYVYEASFVLFRALLLEFVMRADELISSMKPWAETIVIMLSNHGKSPAVEPGVAYQW